MKRLQKLVKLLDIMLADCDVETQGMINAYYKDEFNVLFPSSFRELLTEPFLNSFVAIIDNNFLNNQGLEALEALKSVRPSLPVIFTASHFTEGLYVSAFRMGAEYCFSKPLEVKEIDKSLELIFSYGRKGCASRKNVLLPRYARKLNEEKKNKNIPTNINKVKKHIEKNYNKPQSLDLFASVACMSRYHFCRTFKHCIGVSSVEYLNLIRVKEAKRFLRKHWFSISEICFFIGYNNLCQFERVFKRYEGISPSGYRKEHSKEIF